MSNVLAENVFGHDQAINLLSGAITSQQIPQSLLVTGIPQVGKTTLARTFAMALNCSGTIPPCHQCPSCRKIDSHTHPDIIIFEASETSHEAIKIDQIRALQRNLSLRPHEGRYKIAILSSFERATLAAANALLKTLEEPPAHAILILTAQNATHLLPTIVSRCQIIALKPIADSVISEILQTRWQAPAEEAGLLSRLATGRLGWAVAALADPDLLSRRNQYLSDLVKITAEQEAYRLAYAYSFTKSRQSAIELLNLWLSWWRDVLLISNGSSKGVVNIDLLETLTIFANSLATPQIVEAIQHTYTTLKNLNYNVNLRLNLEVLLLNLPFLTMHT